MKARLTNIKVAPKADDKPVQADDKMEQVENKPVGLTPEENFDRLTAMSDEEFEAILRNAFGG